MTTSKHDYGHFAEDVAPLLSGTGRIHELSSATVAQTKLFVHEMAMTKSPKPYSVMDMDDDSVRFVWCNTSSRNAIFVDVFAKYVELTPFQGNIIFSSRRFAIANKFQVAAAVKQVVESLSKLMKSESKVSTYK